MVHFEFQSKKFLILNFQAFLFLGIITRVKSFGNETEDEVISSQVGSENGNSPFILIDEPKVPQPRKLDQLENLDRASITSACNSRITVSAGNAYILKSPNYPERTPFFSRCNRDFIVPSNVELVLQCSTFNLFWGSLTVTYGISNVFRGTDLDQNAKEFIVKPQRTQYNLDVDFFSVFPSRGFNCVLQAISSVESPPPVKPTTSRPTSSFPANDPCPCGIKSSNRIIGGSTADQNEYPWQAALVNRGQSAVFCGGEIITDKHVLTAAHCTIGKTPRSIQVLLAEHDIGISGDKAVRFDLLKITNHPGYDRTTQDNDFSILELNRRIQFSSIIAPVCLPVNNAETFAGKRGDVTGWGSLSSTGNYPKRLQEVSLTIQSNAQCQSTYSKRGLSIAPNMICAFEKDKDSCFGDSGGPMTVETSRNGKTVSTLVGVVSWGLGCASPIYPGVYARVSTALGWIKQNTATALKCKL